MEYIKKTIERVLTTGTTISCTGNCRVIIPDANPNLFYYFKINLIAESPDIGFFDAYMPPSIPDITEITVQEQAVAEGFYFVDNDELVFADYNDDLFEQ